ncbi:MAG TPA: hypothetical protein VHL11_06435 [Phototrophicaceae bacterium]|jgi:ligand-binding SRPBCC domain-containing protein|nr:hypothetical protein [Phototrophicaceae bacterium]
MMIQPPSNAHIFEKHTLMKTTMDKMLAFHADPKALRQLTPPPIFVQLHRNDRTGLTDGEVEFTLWFTVIPIRWVARHQPGPIPTSFGDRMAKGPMAYWYHEHIFEQMSDGVVLHDRLTLAHQPGLPGILTRLMFDGLPLRILFFYRHLRTRMAVEQ